MSEKEIGLGDVVMMQKGDTLVSGPIDGIKLNRGALERIYIEHLGYLDVNEGWMVVTEVEEENA